MGKSSNEREMRGPSVAPSRAHPPPPPPDTRTRGVPAMCKPRRRHHRPLVVALYVNAALLLAVLVAVLTRGGAGGDGSGWPQFLPAAYAGAPQLGQPIAGGG